MGVEQSKVHKHFDRVYEQCKSDTSHLTAYDPKFLDRARSLWYRPYL